MTITKPYTILGLSFFVLLSVGNLHAQVAQAPTKTKAPIAASSTAQKNPVAVVANVNLTNTTVVVKDGVISGSFALQSFSGQQSDILYGVTIYDTNDKKIESTKLGDVPALQEGSTVTYPIRYTIPSYLKGEVKVYLEAQTKEGLLLGLSQLWKGTMSGVGAGISCTLGEKQEIICTSEKAGVVNVEYYKGSLFASPLSQENVTVEAKKQFVITPKVTPGEYSVVIKNKDSAASFVVSLQVEGAYASIQNLMVFKSPSGTPKITAYVLGNPGKGAMLQATLTSPTGQVCYSAKTPLVSNVFDSSITLQCDSGVAEVTVSAADGTVLATSRANFSVISVAEELKMKENAKKLKDMISLVMVVSLLLVLIVIAVIVIKQRQEKIKLGAVETGTSSSGSGQDAPQQSSTPAV